jgi:D-lactate dehydrogenase
LLLNRKLHRAWNRVREGNFALDGLVGFELADKTVGILGTGRIGQAAARIFSGFGCRVLLHDRFPQPAATAWGGVYVSQEHLLAESEVVSLHIPLTRENHHLFDERLFAAMKPGAYLINTSRGGLIDTRAAIEALKTGRLGGLALDVYEGEEGLFFEDRSQQVIADDVFTRLLTLPNVVITAHQAFLTREALANIAEVTLANARALRDGLPCDNEVRA